MLNQSKSYYTSYNSTYSDIHVWFTPFTNLEDYNNANSKCFMPQQHEIPGKQKIKQGVGFKNSPKATKYQRKPYR